MKINILVSASLLVFLITAVIFSQKQHLKVEEDKINSNYQSEENKTRQSLTIQKKLPSLGFENLLADWNYLNFIQYFGDEKARLETGYSLIPNFFEAIINEDKNFVPAFLVLSTANSVYAGKPNKTVQFLNEILESISSDVSPLIHYLWFYKGVDEMLFLGDLESAKQSFLMAQKGAQEAGEDIVSQRAQEIIRFLETNPDTRRAKIAGWILVFNTAKDNKTKQYALEQLHKLDAK